MPERRRPSAITVDRALCTGSGMCVLYAADTFAHDEETKAVVTDLEGDPVEAVQNAVEACPTGAINIVYEPEGA